MQLRPQLGEGEMPYQEEEVGTDIYDTGDIGPGVMDQGEVAASGAPAPVEPLAMGVQAPPDAMQGQPPPTFSQDPATITPDAPVPEFDPDTASFDERQARMTPQERADWATKKYGGRSTPEAPVVKDPVEERKKFEKIIFEQMGGDPFGRDTMKEVDRITIQKLPDIFNKAFAGKVIWQDRNRLDKKQNEFWQNEVKAFRAHVKERAESDKKNKIEKYKELMGRFDIQTKTEEAEKKRALEAAGKFGSAAKSQQAQRAAQEKAIRTQGDKLREREIKSYGDIAANMKAHALATDPKEKAQLKEQHALLVEEQAAATTERHQFKMQYDKAYAQAWNEKQATLKKRSSAGSPVEGDIGVNPDTGVAPAAPKQGSAPKTSASPAGGKRIESERPSKDGSGKKLRTYSDGTATLVNPDGTEEPVIVKAK